MPIATRLCAVVSSPAVVLCQLAEARQQAEGMRQASRAAAMELESVAAAKAELETRLVAAEERAAAAAQEADRRMAGAEAETAQTMEALQADVRRAQQQLQVHRTPQIPRLYMWQVSTALVSASGMREPDCRALTGSWHASHSITTAIA